jgi:hypothetical protein
MAVEVVGTRPRELQALRQPAMTAEHFRSFLVVRVLPNTAGDPKTSTPLWGSYRLEGGKIRFEPRFPLEPGMRYVAEFDPARFQEVVRELAPARGSPAVERPSPSRLVAEYSTPKPAPTTPAQVLEVYPSSATLPENLLRFYIHFSAPMSRGEAYRHLHLLDAAGKPIDSPFLEIAEELWSSDGKRFTLLFQPGRIKRGLKPREEAGPILEAGKSYSLVIDREWQDARGNPLGNSFRKSFRAGPADNAQPAPSAWSIKPPRAGTAEVLEVVFPEPLDRGLIDRLIVVRDSAGSVVPGEISVTAGETVWRLTPRDPWRTGEYRLEVGTELEDLVGNSVARPFEVDELHPVTSRVTSDTVSLPFRVLVRSR